VTLCVAQVLMGIPSDRRFLRAARRQLGHLFPYLPRQDALHKRRARLAEAIEWLVGVFAAQSPGASDDLLLLDSTPVECGRVGCGRVGIIDAFHGEGGRRHRPDR
jgi:cytochrome P450